MNFRLPALRFATFQIEIPLSAALSVTYIAASVIQVSCPTPSSVDPRYVAEISSLQPGQLLPAEVEGVVRVTNDGSGTER